MKRRVAVIAALVGASLVGGAGASHAANAVEYGLITAFVNLSGQQPPDPARCIGVSISLAQQPGVLVHLGSSGPIGLGELPPNPCGQPTRN